MATDITPARRNVRIEETKYKAGVSESTFQAIGGAINFINYYQTMNFEFGFLKLDANSGTPSYSGVTTPFLDFGSGECFPYNAEIIKVTCRHGAAGSGGTSEIDLKWQPVNSAAAYATIFSTTPKVTSAAASGVDFDTLGTNTTPAGCTAPVLSKTIFDAGDKIKCDILSSMTGNPNMFLVRIYFRPI